MTLEEFSKHVEFDYEETRKDRTGTQWYRVMLSYKGRHFATEFFQGAELEEDGYKPDIERVLQALQVECEWGRMTFLKYCEVSDISMNNAAAKATWIRAMTIYNQLCDFFAEDFWMFDEAEVELA